MPIVTLAATEAGTAAVHSPEDGPRPGAMRSAKAFYCVYFVALGVISPYLALTYRARGLSASQIGLIIGIAPLVRMLSGPLWGALADILQRQRQIFLLAVGGAALAMLGIWKAPAFGLLLLAVLVSEFFGSPIVPLVDATVLTMLGRRRDQYGKVRLWGTLGWGVAGPLAGVLAERAGFDWNFGVAFVFLALALLVASRLPVIAVTKTVAFWRGLRSLVVVRWWLPFMVTAFAVGVGQASLNQLLFLRLADLGVHESTMGLSLAFIMAGELPVLYYSDRLLRLMGPRGLFLTSIVAAAAMLFAVSWMRVGWVILPIQLLHGMAFNGKATALVLFCSQAAPRGMQATSQTLYTAIGALAGATGGALGGTLFDAIGSGVTFRLFGVITAIAGLCFALVIYRRGAAARPTAE